MKTLGTFFLRRPFPHLYRAISTSVVGAFCVRNPALRTLLHIACAPFVFELTRLGLKMETVIARDGDLKGACEWLVDIATQSIQIHGADQVPRPDPCSSSATTPAWAMPTRY